MIADPDEPFIGLEATHIFPISQIEQWNRNGWRNWITDTSPPSEIGDTGLYSPQNGLLLSKTMQLYFDGFYLGVDPDVSATVHETPISCRC